MNRPPLQQYPQQPQQDEPTAFHAFLGQLLRHRFLHIAKSLDDATLGKLMTLDDPQQLASLLSAHNDSRHQKLMSRRFTKSQAPNANRPKMPSGKIEQRCDPREGNLLDNLPRII